MVKRTSPIVEAGLRDPNSRFESPRNRLMIFAIRASRFHMHPFFTSNGVIADVLSRDLVFESLAFRLRPIAMTDADDCSIWRTLQTLREFETVDESTIETYEQRYRAWLNVTDQELRSHWPNWEVEQPKAVARYTELTGHGTPIQELWDRVFGDGPHADYKRVIRNTTQDWTPEGRESLQARFGKLLATIRAIHPLTVDIHNDVMRVLSGPADDSGRDSFTISR